MCFRKLHWHIFKNTNKLTFFKPNINKQTYFDRLKEKGRQSGGMYAMKSIMCIYYYYLLARVWIDI